MDLPTDPDSASAFAPGSVANVGPGFDVMGFAFAGPGDTVTVRKDHSVPAGAAQMGAMTGDGGRLPRDADANVASVVAARMLAAAGAAFGVVVDLAKGLPLGSGLGSSSSSAVAAAVAVNKLLGGRHAPLQLLEFARAGERAACGSAHPDNVAASLLGGFQLVRSVRPLDVVALRVPNDWRVAIVHPHVELETRHARAVLPTQVTLAAMSAQAANAAALVAALHERDLALFGRAIAGDQVVVATRRKLIEGYSAVEHAALGAGAAAFSISGSGPSVFAVCADDSGARRCGSDMVAAWRAEGVVADLFVSPLGAAGAR